MSTHDPGSMDHRLAKAISDAAREARQRAVLTRAEVAGLLGLSPAAYGRLERGERLPSVSTLRKVCKHLEVSADVLLDLRAAGAPWPR
jgi:transcriptional regulator with XRE-family HTH domain